MTSLLGCTTSYAFTRGMVPAPLVPGFPIPHQLPTSGWQPYKNPECFLEINFKSSAIADINSQLIIYAHNFYPALLPVYRSTEKIEELLYVHFQLYHANILFRRRSQYANFMSVFSSQWLKLQRLIPILLSNDLLANHC